MSARSPLIDIHIVGKGRASQFMGKLLREC